MRTAAGTQREPRGLGWAWVLVVLFTVSGVVHLVSPAAFDAQVPDFLPARTAIVLLSGVVELLLAAGLVWPRSRRVAALASAAFLVLIFPGNLWQTWEAYGDWRAGDATAAYLVGTLVRLPFQALFVLWAWGAARRAGARVAA